MAVVKQVDASGQISLGKEFAARTLLVDSPETGVWGNKTATTIPDSDRWLYGPELQQRMDQALAHALEQPGEAGEVVCVA